jgi:hypothetical protein
MALETVNSTANWTNPVVVPTTPQDLIPAATEYAGGLASFGVVMAVWAVFFNMYLHRGHPVISSAIAANFVATVLAFMMFVGGMVAGVVPFLLGGFTAATIAYSYATGDSF